MKLKTYLRGLGIGIIVTTIVMGITLGGGKEKMSDEEIIARAKELGMVESVSEESDTDNRDLPENMANKTEPENADGQIQEKVPESESTPEIETESEAEQSKADEKESESIPENAAEPESQSPTGENVDTSSDHGEVTAGEIVSVQIDDGEDSATVSRRLEELDLIISATQFDRFLCDNGYAKKISPGSYEIAIGSSEETIAKIITKSR